ncbi:MAG TPA: helix-turn-helix domain-containing protein [Tepidiformaceae bacterium]|nr:helix-turn-helix domain-containing protein [Tepidiformaceae bacterium]
MPESTPVGAAPFVTGMNQRVVDLRLSYPTIHGVDVDLLFVAYLLETSRFGRFTFGPVTLDVAVIEDLFARSLPVEPPPGQHRMAPGAHAFYGRVAEELAKSGAKRPTELHYLLAFMRTPEGLPARVFGELAIRPEDVERHARHSETTRPIDVFLSPETVAQRLGVNVQTVRAWIRSGKLPASRLAGRRVLRIRESDIEAVLEPVDPADFQ